MQTEKIVPMEAFILAAGLGTRLRPLTNTRPKALVEIDGQPLLKITIDHLTALGASKIVVNIHHFGEQIADYLSAHSWGTEIVLSDERAELLDTGGGLKKAASLFSGKEPILVHNVDVLSRVDLRQILRQHTESKAIATLAVSNRNTKRYLLFDSNRQLRGWKNKATGETLFADGETADYQRRAFSGIAIVEPALMELLPPCDHPYPIIPEYLNISKQHRIKAFEHDSADWIDVGKPETLPLAAKFINN